LRKKTALAGLALVVFAFILVASSSTSSAADHSAVINTVHDVTRGMPTANPCEGCHIPHDAQGAFLWARTPNASGGGGSVGPDSTTAIKPLCYSCHDGTVAVTGTATVFEPTKANHKTQAATAQRPDGSYYGPGRDCDLCHNPHDNSNTDFLIQGISAGGNVCASCHGGNLDTSQGGSSINHKIHIVPSAASRPIDRVWNPSRGDYSGTRLFDPSTDLVSRAPDAVLACETCHTPHGSVTDENSLNTMSYKELCINCHK